MPVADRRIVRMPACQKGEKIDPASAEMRWEYDVGSDLVDPRVVWR